ncbi:hypothetical protein [Crateriforma conspicua]|uniref:HEAT repeat protein n=1 Tax=Crateriforma conspicua TaxID=2527996 RepID=A0A5C5Y133_9PLAN|nr:hypothetical protein [Crateriforma conspicua]QDV62885.1 hypothetical protein Mal65_20220 [Crateriforma conspicua]TWT68343.1 hypothetical protein Pan14r_05870 [Crateriforma conspicua]
MPGLSLTYEFLAETANAAAVDVLASALRSGDPDAHRRAVDALLRRRCERSGRCLAMHWPSLTPEQQERLVPHAKWFRTFVAERLSGDADVVLPALRACKTLQLVDLTDTIARLAENGKSHAIRHAAADTIRSIAQQLGDAARSGQVNVLGRSAFVTRLAASARRFSMHRNHTLVEAFLLASTWSDSELRRCMKDDSGIAELLTDCLVKATDRSLIDLLAAGVRRRDLGDVLAGAIQDRTDETFQSSFLTSVGTDPTPNTINNLKQLGIPRCCRQAFGESDQLSDSHQAALIYVWSYGNGDWEDTLTLACGALQHCGESVIPAVLSALKRTEPQPAESWLEAAKHVSSDDPAQIQQHRKARLLMNLIEMLDHPDPRIGEAAREVLRPLHAAAMLPVMNTLGQRSRRILGRVVMMVDNQAIQHVSDSLRHPVLQNRLDALLAVDAFAAIDLLSDSMKHIVRNDHQEARRVAAEVMADGTGEETLNLLIEMADLPESSARDAARRSLEKRQESDTEFPANVSDLSELNLN